MYIFILFYTTLLLTGGLIGYFKAHSTPSLIMGLLSTFFLTTLTILYRKGFKRAGYGLLLVVLSLDSFFSWRWVKTLNLFPAGLFSIFSTILLILIALPIQKRLKK
ncbi:MAG: TMEM14 family protein [Burkholderiales bacterium]